jgi:hypothetical protein
VGWGEKLADGQFRAQTSLCKVLTIVSPVVFELGQLRSQAGKQRGEGRVEDGEYDDRQEGL